MCSICNRVAAEFVVLVFVIILAEFYFNFNPPRLLETKCVSIHAMFTAYFGSEMIKISVCLVTDAGL